MHIAGWLALVVVVVVGLTSLPAPARGGVTLLTTWTPGYNSHFNHNYGMAPCHGSEAYVQPTATESTGHLSGGYQTSTASYSAGCTANVGARTITGGFFPNSGNGDPAPALPPGTSAYLLSANWQSLSGMTLQWGGALSAAISACNAFGNGAFGYVSIGIRMGAFDVSTATDVNIPGSPVVLFNYSVQNNAWCFNGVAEFAHSQAQSNLNFFVSSGTFSLSTTDNYQYRSNIYITTYIDDPSSSGASSSVTMALDSSSNTDGWSLNAFYLEAT